MRGCVRKNNFDLTLLMDCRKQQDPSPEPVTASHQSRGASTVLAPQESHGKFAAEFGGCRQRFFTSYNNPFRLVQYHVLCNPKLLRLTLGLLCTATAQAFCNCASISASTLNPFPQKAVQRLQLKSCRSKHQQSLSFSLFPSVPSPGSTKCSHH